MTMNMLCNTLVFLIHLLYLSGFEVKGAWLPLMAPLDSDSRRIELGANGRRMAVGTSDYTINIYDLVTTPVHPNDETMTWKFAGHLSDIDAVNFSLSQDGRFLATRHKSISKQVQVWEIESIANYSVFPTNTEGSYEIESSLEPKNIGTFWCNAEGQSVKLFQAESNLVLAMSCERWLSNRGKVQVFVRDLSSSLPNTDDLAWSEMIPSLEGKNTGDRFGSALSISDGSAEYDFRIAVGCPGFNNNQGLVLVYGASRAPLITWEQIGDDLIGSNVGEQFGAALDTSVNSEPYLLIGSPGWTRVTRMDDNIEDDDNNNGQDTSESIDSGLVRLFHWRRSGSSFRSPRRWVMVGDPMFGRNNGDRFGIQVAISRTGERIAVAASPMEVGDDVGDDGQHPADYIGVYERQSWDSWGLLVNDVLLHGNSRGADVVMALNDWGSMLVTVSPHGSVKALLDDSPLCGIPTIHTSHFDGGESTFPQASDFEMLLSRQTCRMKDNLVENQTICSEQRVYRGTYEACSWTDISIADFPSMISAMAPSIAPSLPTERPSAISIVVPSSSPSYFSSVTQSEAPSLRRTNFDSFFASVSPSAPPTFASAQPSLRNSVNLSRQPSTLGIVEENEMSFSPSAFPTSLDVPNSLRFSPHPTIQTSQSPTDRATQRDHEEMVLVNTCHCNIFDDCIDLPLSESSPELRICVFVESDANARILSLDSARLRQDDYTFSIVYGGTPINNDGDTTLQCHGTSANMCQIETSVSFAFFGRNRPSSIVVEGDVLVEKSHPFRQHEIAQIKIPFWNFVPLERTDILPPSPPSSPHDSNNHVAAKFLRGGTAAFVLLLAVCVVSGWCCKKYFCNNDHDKRKVKEFFGI